MYLEGKGVTKDCGKAIEWFKKAIEQGAINAKSNLAIIYAEGLCGDKDYEKAYQLNKEAAKQGLCQSQYNLGIMYLNGWGVAKDECLALKWITQSTKKDAEIQYQVGLMYQFGTGIAKEKDIVRAKKLYTKAAKQGHGCAKHRLEEISEEREPPLAPSL